VPQEIVAPATGRHGLAIGDLAAIQKAPPLVQEFVCRRGRCRWANVSRKKQFAFDNFIPEIVIDGPRAGARLWARFAEQFYSIQIQIWQ